MPIFPGPLWLIKKRMYTTGLLFSLIQYTLPVQLVLLIQFEKDFWWKDVQSAHGIDVMMLVTNICYTAYSILPACKPWLFCLSLLLSRLALGFLSKHLHKRSTSNREDIKEDRLSAWITRLGLFTACTFFFLSHIPLQYHYAPRVACGDPTYTHAEALLEHKGLVSAGLYLFVAVIMYLLTRQVVAQWSVQKK